ncbi:MAG: MBOAT family protein [Anaerolineaceae bacterium]|nr:MBOAT family protein [Anaerolineaceae bacterium]
MTIPSLLFLACAAAAALIYWKIPAAWRAPWLLLLSFGFIATYSWQFVLVLALFVLVNYAVGLKMEGRPERMQAWSYFGLAFNLLFLFVLKYNDFYLPALSPLLTQMGLLAAGDTARIIVPIGLSFLMVQAISYVLDLRNKRLHAEKRLIPFAVYLLYFPKLLSGPIEKARTFLPRLDQPRPVDRAQLERSLALIVTGLFRKIVFADPLFNFIPTDVFTAPLHYAGQDLLLHLLAYSFALYNDFAGYTGIVRGISLWFGIELSPNFNLPYLARNFTEFWARWHISLSNWLRDYIFFPFSRMLARHGQKYAKYLNLILPPLVTMIVSGLWHGLGWGLIVWGALHGLYQVIERLPSLWHKVTPPNEQPKWKQALGTSLTFIFASAAWVPFHTSLTNSLQFFSSLVHWQKPEFYLFRTTVLEGKIPLTSWSDFGLPNPMLLMTLVLAIVLDILQLRGKKEEFLQDWPGWATGLFMLILLIIGLLATFSDQIAPFVYQTF